MRVSEILIEIVAATIGAALIAAISAIIHRSRSKPVEGASNVMKPPRVLLAIGVICSTLFLVPAAFAWFIGVPKWIALLFLALASPGFFLIAAALRTRCVVQAYGLQIRTVFKPQTWIAWSDIDCVQWAPIRQGFVLRTKASGSFLIDLSLRGLPHFARQLQNGVPADKIDERARTPLAQAAAGVPPEIRMG